MRSKLLKQLRKEAKEDVYLTQSLHCSGPGKITIIHEVIDEPFGLTIVFYDPVLDRFVQDEVAHYNTVEEALPDLRKARRCYILGILHCDYRELSKGDQKRKETEILKQQEYQKYLQQF